MAFSNFIWEVKTYRRVRSFRRVIKSTNLGGAVTFPLRKAQMMSRLNVFKESAREAVDLVRLFGNSIL